MLNTRRPSWPAVLRFTFDFMLNLKQVAASFVLVLALATTAKAQPQRAVADKIVAIVGDKIILQSDIKNSISDMQRQGTQLPDSAECLLTQQAIISKVLMLQAQKDSLPVTDEEVEAELEQRIRYFVNQVGTIEELEKLAGKTVFQIKDEARESVREKKLADAMQRKIVENVRITPQEVQAFYNKIPKDSLPFFESELEVGQIILYPKASRELEQYILSEMYKYKQQLESNQIDFCTLAKNVSEDPGSKDRCGRYEINRGEKTWDPIFMSTAFRLKEGEISAPIKSKFGYHILRVEKRNGDNVVVDHILRVPPVTDDEINAAIVKLDSVRTKIVAGRMGFNEAASKYSEDESAQYVGPFVMSRNNDTYVTIDELGKDLVAVISKMNVGDISQPAPFEGDQGKKGVRIVYLKSRSEPHRMNLDDDYSKISSMALEEKKNEELDKWLKAKIPSYYIMVDNGAAAECPLLNRYNTTDSRGF